VRPSPAHQLHAQIALLELTVSAIMVDLPNLWLVLLLKYFFAIDRYAVTLFPSPTLGSTRSLGKSVQRKTDL
jgi:ABC-type dipeptide/oligopeptide/nickel transport system permease component